MTTRFTRRKFLKTVAAAATVTIAGTKSTGRVLGANDVIRVGVAGINGRGGSHINAFARMKGVQVTHLIDPDTRLFASRSKTVQGLGGNQPRTEKDIRQVLEGNNVDVISIATPNHWHALMTMWACQAGKDVYVEKPCSHNVREGKQALDIARKYNRIVQHGTQSRTEGHWQQTMAVIQSGKLGRLKVAYGLCYKRRDNANGMAPTVRQIAAPQELDFNLWLGPAAQRAYHENLVHYRWHWFWDFGNGDLGNQGVHEMDKARWAITGATGATLPRSVVCVGGRYGPRDAAETANTQVAVFDYGQAQLIFEVRGLQSDNFHRQGVGNVYVLEEGIIAGNTFIPRGTNKAAPLPKVEARRRPGSSHFDNFIAAVRSRRREDLNADILEGHYSSALCHLANISYRLGQNAAFEPRTRAFNGNTEATDALARMEEHLGKTNSLRLADLQLRVGPKLEIDPKTESFTGKNDAANRLLGRENRAPFVVREMASSSSSR
jgi:predicted dehydrogenase